MQELSGKVAFVTGAGSGIGLSLARACGAAGMKVMLADVDETAIEEAVELLQARDIECASVQCDVANLHSVQQAAKATIERFGYVHLLANNAGVLIVGGVGENSQETWRWAMDVNVMGVIHGVEVFLPLMRAHGEGGHILNTASVGGHASFGNMLAYCTTKHAVIGYTESLSAELQDENIGVSALCPGFTNTRIAETGRFEENMEGGNSDDLGFVGAVESGMSPDVVADYALDQIQQEALFIFTHPGTRGEVEARWPLIQQAYDAADSSAILALDPDSKRIATKAVTDELYKD